MEPTASAAAFCLSGSGCEDMMAPVDAGGREGSLSAGDAAVCQIGNQLTLFAALQESVRGTRQKSAALQQFRQETAALAPCWRWGRQCVLVTPRRS
jgi:hypothetical protein